MLRLGLSPTGEKAEYADAMYTAHTLPSDWFLLVMNKAEHPLIAPESLLSLSGGCEVIACSVEEHVMVCTAEAWKNGSQLWRIEHNAQESIDHISSSGALPTGYANIKDTLSRKQEQAGGKNADTDDFFDIPLRTAKSIVGFKHDEDSGLEGASFEVYQSNKSKPWWKFW
jgi:hypothetical protein